RGLLRRLRLGAARGEREQRHGAQGKTRISNDLDHRVLPLGPPSGVAARAWDERVRSRETSLTLALRTNGVRAAERVPPDGCVRDVRRNDQRVPSVSAKRTARIWDPSVSAKRTARIWDQACPRSGPREFGTKRVREADRENLGPSVSAKRTARI